MQLEIAVDFATVIPCMPDYLGLTRIFVGSLAYRSLQPGVKAVRLDAQAPTHCPHRKLCAILGHKRVSHFAYLAKYAVAFCKMSRSSVTRTSSRFSRRISTSLSALPEPRVVAHFFFHT